MDDVRIQIVNYKTKSYLTECLASLENDLSETDLQYTVAILDNASGDDLSDIPKLFSGLIIETYQGQKNIGFGAGHNFLAQKGQSHLLLLLNPDIQIIESHTIDRLVTRMQEGNADVIGPRLITNQGTTQKWDHGKLLPLWILRMGWNSWKESKKILSSAWVSGAVFLIKKDCYDKHKGFDENFFLYVEEVELCLRIISEDGKVLYDPTITVHHYGGVVAKKWKHMPKSILYFLRKHILNII